MRPRRARTASRAIAIGAAALAAMALTASPAAAAKIDYGMAPQASLSAADYGRMGQAKVDFLRLGFDWTQDAAGDCTPLGGACDWGFKDSQIGAASAFGLDVLPIVFGSAPFVNSNPRKPPTNNLAAYQDFVQAAVQRYGPNGVFWTGPYQAMVGNPLAPVHPIREWQIWNEQSSNAFFEPKPSAKKYGKLLKAASSAIRGVDPGAEILTGGMFPDTGPKGIKIEKYLAELYRIKGIEKTFDTVSVHPYADDPKELISQLMRARRAMDKAGDKKADISISELGYSSGCPRCPKNNVPPVAKKNEREQAKALTDAFKALKKASNKLNLVGITWFTWQDTNSKLVCRFCQRAGLLDVQGKPKPAYNAFKKAAG